MKKYLIVFALLIFILSLTGCHKDSASDPTEKVSISSAEGTSADASNPEPTAEPLSRAELERILDVFEEYSYLDLGIHPDLDYAGYCCDYFPDCVDKSQSFTEEIELNDWPYKTTQNYYRVVSGAYSTESGFNAKLDEIFSEDCKARYLELSKDAFRFKNNETYAAEQHYLSYTPLSYRLEISAEQPAENTVVLMFTGSMDFDVTLVKGADGKYRIDKSDRIREISRVFSFDNDLELVYGDDTINRPSSWDMTVSSEISEFWSMTRFEQCVSMLKSHADINYDFRIRPDYSQSIYKHPASEQPFYKVTGTPLADEKLFLQKVGLIYSEKFQEQFLSNLDNRFLFKDGELYVMEGEPQKLAANGGYIRLDKFELNESSDENSILMKLTVVSDPPSGTIEYSVKFVKEKGDFYKIDEISSSNDYISLAECIWFYSELICGDISISI